METNRVPAAAVLLALAACARAAVPGEAAPAVPPGPTLPPLDCTAEQTGGFHDYPGGEERYEPALFHPQSFTLEENAVFMMNLAGRPTGVDLYLTMYLRARGNGTETGSESGAGSSDDDSPAPAPVNELECRQVRGATGDLGFSCVNVPPSEMILINARTLRFTRTAVGGWTFSAGAGGQRGDSVFVEYGQCRPASGTVP